MLSSGSAPITLESFYNRFKRKYGEVSERNHKRVHPFQVEAITDQVYYKCVPLVAQWSKEGGWLSVCGPFLPPAVAELSLEYVSFPLPNLDPNES